MTPFQFVFGSLQAIVVDPAQTVCTPMISVVNPGSSWYGTITPSRNIPVKTLCRSRITTEIPHQWHRSSNFTAKFEIWSVRVCLAEWLQNAQNRL